MWLEPTKNKLKHMNLAEKFGKPLEEKQWVWLGIALMALATWSRFHGLSWGLPYMAHPDEARMIDGIWQAYWGYPIFESDYGQLPMKLIAFAWWVWGLFDQSFGASPTDGEHFLTAVMIARTMGATAGCFCIGAILHFGPKWFSWKASFWAALIVTLSPLHISDSHHFTVDIFLAAFVTLTVFAWLRAIKEPSVNNAILLGLAVGACLSCKANAMPLIPLVFVGWVIAFWPLRRGLTHWGKVFGYGAITWAAMAICYIQIQPEATNPSQFFLLDKTDPAWWYSWNFPDGPHKLEWNILFSRGYLKPLWSLGVSDLGFWLLSANYIFLWGPIFLLLPILLWLSDKPKNLRLISALGVFYFGLHFPALTSEIQFMRYGLGALIVLAIICGVFISTVKHANPLWLRFAFTLTVLLSIGNMSAWMGIYDSVDPRDKTGQWIDTHIPEKSTICADPDLFTSPIFNLSRVNMESLPIYSWDSQSRHPVQDKRLQTHWFGPLKSAEEIQHLIDQTLSRCQYMVLSSRMSQNVLRLPKNNPLRQFYEQYWRNDHGLREEIFRHETKLSIFNVSLSMDWIEATNRVIEKPQFRVFKLNTKAGQI